MSIQAPYPAVRHDPVLVGAVGGSGTRVVARLIRLAGVFIGGALNHAEDSVPVMRFYDGWLRRFLQTGGTLSEAELVSARAALGARLAEHLAGLQRPEAPWGIKVPRNILMMPFWERVYPELRFVHVVRDGRDIAYSSDRNQLGMVGDLVLSSEEQRQGEKLRAIAYWRRVNLAAADLGERHLGRRYLRVRFEELCSKPIPTCEAIWRFVGVEDPAHLRENGVREITPPPSIGRWRTQPADEVAEVVAMGAPALERFGYGQA